MRNSKKDVNLTGPFLAGYYAILEMIKFVEECERREKGDGVMGIFKPLE